MKRLPEDNDINDDGENSPVSAAQQPTKRVKMPKKNKFRMQAHINPFNPLTMPTPQNPRFVDWSIHFPTKFGVENNNENKIVVNSYSYPITYPTEEV